MTPDQGANSPAETTEFAAASTKMRAFLSGRDWGCTNCGYNLRDSNGVFCPECQLVVPNAQGMTVICEDCGHRFQMVGAPACERCRSGRIQPSIKALVSKPGFLAGIRRQGWFLTAVAFIGLVVAAAHAVLAARAFLLPPSPVNLQTGMLHAAGMVAPALPALLTILIAANPELAWIRERNEQGARRHFLRGATYLGYPILVLLGIRSLL